MGIPVFQQSTAVSVVDPEFKWDIPDPDPESGFGSGSRKAKIICLNFAKWQVDLYSISAMFVQLSCL